MSKTDLQQPTRAEYLARVSDYLIQLQQRVDELIDADITVAAPTKRFIRYRLDRAKRILAASKHVSLSSWPALHPELEKMLSDLVADIGRACPGGSARLGLRNPRDRRR